MIHFDSSKILIPVDFSETSLLAIKHGAFLAKYTKGDVYLIHVINKQFEHYAVVEQPMYMHDAEKYEKGANDKLNELAASIKSEYGVSVNTIVAIGNPTKEIIKAEKEIGASLVVMGTHGYSPLEELMIGSNALKVITHGTCPVMAMSENAKRFGYSNILIPIDTSGHSRQKVGYAIEIAKAFSAHLHVLGLLGKDEADEEKALNLILNQIKALADEKKVICTTELSKNVKNRAQSTINYSEKKKADLIIIMTDQDAEISGFFLGPYSQQIIHLSKVPVIAIKPEDHPENVSWSVLSGTSGL